MSAEKGVRLFRPGVMVVLIGLLLCGSAFANIVVAPPTVSGLGPFTWSYNAILSGNSGGFTIQNAPANQQGTLIIYDFWGYIPGSEFAPSGWTFVGANSGPAIPGITPGTIVSGPDNAAVMNLAWVYTGASAIVNAGPLDLLLGAFGANSTSTVAGQTEYASQDYRNSLGTRAINSDATLAPLAPEPGSLFLLGGALFGVSLLRRKKT